MSKNEDDIEEDRIIIVDAFRGKHGQSLIGTTLQKVNHAREHFLRIQQRVLRHPPYSHNASKGYERQELTRIESILAGGAKPWATHVLGYVTKLDVDQYCLEDLSGRLAISLAQLESSNSIISEGCLVIAVGQVFEEDEEAGYTLYAQHLFSPNPETRSDTERIYPGLARSRWALPVLNNEDSLVMQGLVCFLRRGFPFLPVHLRKKTNSHYVVFGVACA